MEEVYIIKKKQIPDFINKSLQNYQVFGPIQKDGIVSFSSIMESCDLALDYLNTITSPKHIFFPQTETLFKFSYTNPVTLQESAIPSKDLMIFGIRPCDTHAIKIMDTLFHGTYPDKQYLTKRKKSILLGIGCNNPSSNCFCPSVGGNPHGKRGLDVLFTDIGNRYYVEAITQKGNNLIKQFSFFSQAHKNDYKECKKVTDTAQKKIKRHMDVNHIQNKLDKIFEHGIWEIFSQACIGCGICTYLCPTCHCFDIHDESTSKRGGRIRVWDSCMYPEFTLQASGYNPRPTRKNRLRNRIYHKFYSFPRNNDIIACVGCGRCINMCPVNIDIIEIINQAREVSK